MTPRQFASFMTVLYIAAVVLAVPFDSVCLVVFASIATVVAWFWFEAFAYYKLDLDMRIRAFAEYVLTQSKDKKDGSA